MPRARLHRIERNFKHHVRIDFVVFPPRGEDILLEVSRQFQYLHVCQSAVRFTDSLQFSGEIILHGKGVVAEDAVALAVAPFRPDDHHVQRGQFLLEL